MLNGMNYDRFFEGDEVVRNPRCFGRSQSRGQNVSFTKKLVVSFVIIVVFGLTILFFSKSTAAYSRKCDDEDCVTMLESFGGSIDRGANQCHNFYSFVCGRYVHPKPTVEAFIGKVSNKLVRSWRESYIPETKQTIRDKMIAIYRNCVRDLTHNQSDYGALTTFIRQSVSKEWPRFDSAAPKFKNPKEALRILINLSLRYDLNVLFQLKLSASDKNPSVHLESIDYRELTHPSDGGQQVTYIIELMQKIYGRRMDTDYVKLAEKVVFMETELRDMLEDATLQLRIKKNRKRSWQKMRLAEMSGYHEHFTGQDWVAALNDLFLDHGAINNDTEVVLSSRHLLPVIERFLESHYSSHNLVDFIALFIIRNLGAISHRDLFEHRTGYLLNMVLPDHSMDTVHKLCVSHVSYLLPYAHEVFVANHFIRGQSTQILIGIAKNITEQVKNSIPIWFSDKLSATIALESLEHITFSLPLANLVEHDHFMNRVYSRIPDITKNSSYIENYIGIKNAHGVERLLFETTDHSVPLIEYSEYLQKIIISAASLHLPTFSVNLPMEINYAGIGHEIARELIRIITHKDLEGKNRRQLHRASAIGKLDKSLHCISEQLEKVHNITTDMTLTEDESMSSEYDIFLELSAVKTAWRALESSGIRTPLVKISGVSDEQLFYLSACHTHCGQDPAICNAVMSNIPEFGKAFSCSAKDAMVNKETCPTI